MKHIALIATAIVMLACGQIQKGTEMNKDFLQLATDRYSVRSFSSTPVGQDVIDLILKAGQVAPTAVNSQPQKIYVVRSASGMKKMEALSPCMYGAPHCFIFCYNDENVIPRGENDGSRAKPCV